MKSAEFQVLLAVAQRLVGAEFKDRLQLGVALYHSAKLLSNLLVTQHSALSTQHSALSTQHSALSTQQINC
ncbi:hypothetical protein [Nostoc sp. UHCC 0870]|uniref:hypothetical protein n=1 Tax=Nostoc sp. UHCC 0870 TaxID=2914041 RepID=UPI001EDCF947|nr:hypothetical protein [Nostoc sp. UHCC 0870]UKO95960.1 hypothetical protein L6494_14900 [Nostoc sp. UHCC 0870]